jgi:ATP-binding cassette subfamily A (ABC1) protein 3
MKLMGMKGYLHWLAWMLKYAITMIVTSVLITFLFHVSTRNGAIINFTHFTITFVFIFLYALSVIAFSFAVAAFCSHGMSEKLLLILVIMSAVLPFFCNELNS